jgi:4-hydroxyphenylpyruvate dioxygenase
MAMGESSLPISSANTGHARSIATVSLSGTLSEKLEAAAAAGFDAVEIFENDLLSFDGSPADVRRIAEGLGLAIVLFQPFRDFEAMPEPQRGRNFDRAERKFDVMQSLGTDLLLVCSNVQPSALDDDSRAAADFAAMAERAAARGLRVGYEALAWGRHVNRWAHAWKIVQEASHPALGLIVDSFHTLAIDDDPSGIATVPADKLFFVQLADGPRLSMDVLSWSRHFRNFPGQGQLPVADFLRAALATGYRGPLSLEIFNDDFRAAPARQTALDGLRSLVYLESEVAAAPAAPSSRPPLRRLPPLPRSTGFEFLEFAVNEARDRQLAAWLAKLGFRHAGHHRSKAVDLYRQGGINLILNREPDSAASELFELHGTAVCAMALAIDDTGPAMERAAALQVSTWRERTGTDERHIPAVRAPDGMLIHLVAPDPSGRTIYDDDFLLQGVPKDGLGLTAIDHIVQALPYGRLDSFLLFYRSLFGFEPEPIWELPDPYGLIRSRAVVSPDRDVRLSFNISESRNTATGRFVTSYGGAGVQQIALATRDIFAAVERARANGLALLPIPENYYDDLGARFGLDDALLVKLRRLNLLYDRDGAGEFFHAYTETFDDRFYFEILERRGGYQKFGAANAAVRMAAQAQRGATALPL